MTLLQVIADLLQYPGGTITIHHCAVQWQSGISDCAIAFATALHVHVCTGQDPTGSVFAMRPHLLKCLQNQRIAPFPEHSRRSVVKDPTPERATHILHL